jgi:hypothetical protein
VSYAEIKDKLGNLDVLSLRLESDEPS